MPHFDADAITPPPADLEPVSFSVGGGRYRCVPTVTLPRARRLRDDMLNGRDTLAVIVDFLEDVIDPADRPAFAARILDEHDPVDPAGLVTVFLALCTEYAKRANPDDDTAHLLTGTTTVEPDPARVGAVLRMGGEIG